MADNLPVVARSNVAHAVIRVNRSPMREAHHFFFRMCRVA
jgi:hypothetical protein